MTPLRALTGREVVKALSGLGFEAFASEEAATSCVTPTAGQGCARSFGEDDWPRPNGQDRA